MLFASGSYQLAVTWDNENARFYANIIGNKSGHEDDDNDTYAEACDFNSFEIIGNIHDKAQSMTDEQRWKLSQAITQKWKDGVYKNRKTRPKAQTRAELVAEIKRIREMLKK